MTTERPMPEPPPLDQNRLVVEEARAFVLLEVRLACLLASLIIPERSPGQWVGFT